VAVGVGVKVLVGRGMAVGGRVAVAAGVALGRGVSDGGGSVAGGFPDGALGATEREEAQPDKNRPRINVRLRKFFIETCDASL
jgi:hypothetical protein